jgi:hypothetical protein
MTIFTSRPSHEHADPSTVVTTNPNVCETVVERASSELERLRIGVRVADEAPGSVRGGVCDAVRVRREHGSAAGQAAARVSEQHRARVRENADHDDRPGAK